MDLRDFDNYWVELEKEKLLGIGPETLKKIVERILSESHLKLRTLEENEHKDLVATSQDRLGKDAKTLVRVEKESSGVGKDEVDDLYSEMVEMNALGAIYIINSYFTKEARDFGNGLPLRLVDRKELSDLIYETEALKFEKAFVSDINDTKATRYFRSKIKQKITSIFLGLKDKIEEIDRRYLPIGYFSIKKVEGSGESWKYAYIDLSNGDLFYIDEGNLKKTDIIKRILELPPEAKQQLIDLIEQGDLPYEHLNKKSTDILLKKDLVGVYDRKKGGGIFAEIAHFISFVVAEIAEPIGIPRGKYQESSITSNNIVGANVKIPPLDHPYNLEYFIEVSSTQEEFEADAIKYKPLEIVDLLRKILKAEVKFNYSVYFPYYVAKYSGPQGVKYERVYSPKFKEFFPKSGSYSSVHQVIDKFPDFPYMILALLYMGYYVNDAWNLIHVLASCLLFVTIAVGIGVGLKGLFRTERTTPFYATHDYGVKSIRFGFPSLHSLASMGAASFTYFIRPGGEVLSFIMLLISFFYIRSRLRIGAHSRTDVIGGAIIGFLLGIALGIYLLTPAAVKIPREIEAVLALIVVVGMVGSLVARLKYIHL